MIGTALNGATIVLCGLAGLKVRKQLSPRAQQRLKVLLGGLTIYTGLSMAWSSLKGTVGQVLLQGALALLALILGRLTGRWLGLQANLNRLGRFARRQFDQAQVATDPRFSDGFVTCTILFCVGPMALLGALEDGLKGDVRILAIKSAMDGLATLAFVQRFGWGAIVSALPVVAYQGTITLAARVLEPRLAPQALLDPVSVAGGLILCAVALVILEVRKVELADYLPALAYAPLLYWLLR